MKNPLRKKPIVESVAVPIESEKLQMVLTIDPANQQTTIVPLVKSQQVPVIALQHALLQLSDQLVGDVAQALARSQPQGK